MIRPCGCPGPARARHLDACPEHGRSRWPSGRGGLPRTTTRVRLPTEIAEDVVALVDGGYQVEAADELATLRKRLLG